MKELHFIQTLILIALGKSTSLPFGKIKSNIDYEIEGDSLNYHLKTLVKLGYVDKEDKKYSLTTKGKMHISNVNFDDLQVEKKPKTTVMVMFTRKRQGETEYLISRRLKHPFLNALGFVTGKVRAGNSMEKEAIRESQEEVGLTPMKMKMLGIQRWTDFDQKGELIHDAHFYTYHVTKWEGALIKETAEAENKWMRLSEIASEDKPLPSLKYLMDHGVLPVNGITTYAEKRIISDIF